MKVSSEALESAKATLTWRLEAERATGRGSSTVTIEELSQRFSKIARSEERNVRQGRPSKSRRRQAYVLANLEETEGAAPTDLNAPRTYATSQVFTVQEPSEEAKAALRHNLRNIAAFAEVPVAELAENASFARLLALRYFGGWSLEQIARHDNRSVEQVAEAWSLAKNWVARFQSAQSGSGVVTLDLLDRHVLRAVAEMPQLIHSLEWRTFEKIIAGALEQFGYSIELSQGTKDGGVDVLAIRHDAVFGEHRYLLQAKKWAGRVGVAPVRELLFLRQKYGATKACLATTSQFTRGAWCLADEHRWELELRDFERLQEWLSLLRSDR